MKRKSDEYYKELSYVDEQQWQAIDEDLTKMRKEIFELYRNELSAKYSEKEIHMALAYFLCTPSITIYSTPSYFHILICCESARENLK